MVRSAGELCTHQIGLWHMLWQLGLWHMLWQLSQHFVILIVTARLPTTASLSETIRDQHAPAAVQQNATFSNSSQLLNISCSHINFMLTSQTVQQLPYRQTNKPTNRQTRRTPTTRHYGTQNISPHYATAQQLHVVTERILLLSLRHTRTRQ